MKADDAQAKYEKCARRPFMTMADYMGELKRAHRTFVKEDPGTTISDVSFARCLLRRSGLTRMEQRQVLSLCGAAWDTQRTSDALKLM